MARTFQNIELFANLTVLDNLMLGRTPPDATATLAAALWLGRAQREEMPTARRVEEIIDFLELEQWRRLPVGLLPYGVQKRVELGRALAMEPKLLLLDEPVAGMNVEETEDMARYILDIGDELGIADDPGRARHAPGDGPRRPGHGARLRPAASPPARPSEIQRDPEVIGAYLGGADPKRADDDEALLEADS